MRATQTVIVTIIGLVLLLSPGLLGAANEKSSDDGGSLDNNKSRDLANTPWPTFKHDNRRTGLSPYDTSKNLGDMRWMTKMSKAGVSGIESSAVIGANGTVYIASMGGHVFALYPNGTKKWTLDMQGFIRATPAIARDGTIYIENGTGSLTAVDANGNVKWGFAFDSPGMSSPAIGVDGTIYVTSRDHYLHAINPDGTERWKFKDDFMIESSPAIGQDGIIYYGSMWGKLHAVYSDGRLKWDFDSDESLHTAPAIGSDGTIYFGSYDEGHLFAVYPNGTQKWMFKTGGDSIQSSPAIGSDGTIYFGDNDFNLYALFPNESLRWKFQTSGNIASSPAIGSDGTIFVGSDDNNLYAINSDGTLKWKYLTKDMVSASPTIAADGTIFIGSKDDYFYAIGPMTRPSPPRALKGTMWTDSVLLSWIEPVDNGGVPIQEYDIFKGTTPGGISRFTTVSGSTLSMNDTSVSSGQTYFYYVTARNSKGESNPSNWISLLLPAIPPDLTPTLAIESPREGSFLSTKQVAVSGTASDDGSVQKVELSRDGAAWLSATGTTSWSGNLELAEGPGIIWAKVTDNNGNTNKVSVHVIVDTIGPSINVLSPSDKAILRTKEVHVLGTCTDAGGVQKVEISADGTTWQLVTGTTSWSALLSLGDGKVSIQVKGTDVAGNSNIGTINVTIDSILPVVTIVQPKNGEYLPKGKITVSGIATDNLGIVKVEICSNDGPWSLANGTSSWVLHLAFENGQSIIHARATDIAGNINEGMVAVTIDGESPSIEILQPLNKAISSERTVKVEGRAADNIAIQKVELSKDGTNWTVASGSANWTGNLTLDEGMDRPIFAKATDIAGNARTTSIIITMDVTRPQVNISLPSNGADLKKKSVEVEGTSSDNLGIKMVEVSTDGSNWAQVGGPTEKWHANMTLKEGKNTIYARATDLANNTETTKIVVYFNTTPSTVSSKFAYALYIALAVIIAVIVVIVFNVWRKRTRGI